MLGKVIQGIIPRLKNDGIEVLLVGLRTGETVGKELMVDEVFSYEVTFLMIMGDIITPENIIDKFDRPDELLICKSPLVPGGIVCLVKHRQKLVDFLDKKRMKFVFLLGDGINVVMRNNISFVPGKKNWQQPNNN